MRASLCIRRIVCVAALVATALAPAAASATQIDLAALNGTFATGAGGWTSTSSCTPLCTVTTAIDPGPGASEPGSATVIYTTLAGLLGGLASGTSTWTSPTFTWAGATPDSAVVSYARKAAIGGLLTVGGSAGARLQLRDLTTGATATLASDGISTADSGFTARSVALDPALLIQAHSYRLLLTTNLAAAALLSDIRVSYDDIALTASVASTVGGDPSGAGGAGGAGGSGAGTQPSTGGGTDTALHLAAASVVRYRPGHPVTLRVRATRAGKPIAGLLVTLRMGTTTRRLATGRDGSASLTLVRRTRAPLRITYRVGTAGATTWARPR